MRYKFKYLKYIWHDPNCPAWNRNPKNNKPYSHLVLRGDSFPCFCGYDKDHTRLRKFIKGDK